jgi:single-stranded-DNA-specific exonuclease
MMNIEIEEYLKRQLDGETPKDWKKEYPIDKKILRAFKDIVTKSDVVFVAGDYDADGICSSLILKKGLRELFPEKTITALLPDRFRDGYGMNKNQIDKIANVLKQMEDRGKGFKNPCIITCDNGTACREVFDYAKKKIPGIATIVTDHHLPTILPGQELSDVLPEVDLLCNPHINGFSYTEYCGAGVALRLMESLNDSDHVKPLMDELRIYAGIATVADMVEMKKDNWVITRTSLDLMKEGLEKHTLPPALDLLFASLNIVDKSQINEGFYGFTLGPLFNAMGRLENYGANKVLKFLDSKVPSQDMCDYLIENNQTRKSIVNEVSAELFKKRGIMEHEGIKPIWLMLPDKPMDIKDENGVVTHTIDRVAEEGLCGLYATKIVERTGAPAIVLTPSRVDPAILKGSGRSIPGFNLHKYLSEVASPYLLGFGGHQEACGLSCDMKGLKELSKLSNLYDTEPFLIPEEEQEERPLFFSSLPDMVEDYKELQAEYAPFGMGYNAPLYAVECNSAIQEFHTMGNGKHFWTKQDNVKIVHFNHENAEISNKEHFYLTGQISENYYLGMTTYQFLANEACDSLEREQELENEMGDEDFADLG